MKDHFAADRRDPVVKKLEREGLNALISAVHTQRIA